MVAMMHHQIMDRVPMTIMLVLLMLMQMLIRHMVIKFPPTEEPCQYSSNNNVMLATRLPNNMVLLQTIRHADTHYSTE